MEFTLLWSALLGVGALYAVVYWEARRGNAADCSRSVWDTALAAGIGGLVVGRLGAMLGNGTNPLTEFRDVLIVRGGVDPFWATVGAFATFAVLTRGEMLQMGDAVAPAALAGLAGWHAGCLFTDSCLGTPSDLPWAYALSGSEVTRHPVELYAALLLAAGSLALLWWKSRYPPTGVVAAAGVTIASGARLVTEPLRPGLGRGLEWFYAMGFAIGLIGVAVFYLRSRHPRPGTGTAPPA